MGRLGIFAVVITVLFGLSAWSEDERPTLPTDAKLSDKINSWAEGVVMSVDADACRFSIRGLKREYSTAYAAMLKDIEEKTTGLDVAARERKSAEIRASYTEKLAGINEPDGQSLSNFTFYLPAKNAKLYVLNETGDYGRRDTISVPDAAKMSEAERRTMQSLNDLKVGERVIVGFEGGVINNNAYSVIKISNGAPVPASFKTEGTGPEGAPPTGAPVRPALEPGIASNDTAVASKADLETTRLIRENINADKSLSPEARAVQILTVNGQVTLRGTVKNEDEKRVIFRKAALQVGEAKITNELQIAK